MPLFQTCRWTALLAGIYWGVHRYNINRATEEEVKSIEVILEAGPVLGGNFEKIFYSIMLDALILDLCLGKLNLLFVHRALSSLLR